MPLYSLSPELNVFSDSQLLSAFNTAMAEIDSNFAYVLGQVTSPLPPLQLADVGRVVGVTQSGSNAVLSYVDSETVINLQKVFNKFLTDQSSLTLQSDFDITLINPSTNLRAFTVTARPNNPYSVRNHYFELVQVSSNGEMNETHKVDNFTVNANNISFTSNVGLISFNNLQVGTLILPTALGADQTVLGVNNNSLGFISIPKPFTEDAVAVTQANSKPLILPSLSSTTNYVPTVKFSTFESGLGHISATDNVFLKVANGVVFETKNMTGKTTKALKVNNALILPSASTQSATPDTGSLWYEGQSLFIQTTQGPAKFTGQLSAGTPVTTDTDESFTLHPDAKLALGGGTTAEPSLRVGSGSFSATDSKLAIGVNNKPIVGISEQGVLTSHAASNGVAALNLDSTVGLNSPTKPTYTFQNATGLGLYRVSSTSVGIAAEGSPVVVFSKDGLNAQNKKITSVATPVSGTDAVNKSYVDSKLPAGTITGTIPTFDSAQSKYVGSSLTYTGVTLTVGDSVSGSLLSLKAIGGGAVVLKAPTTTQTIQYEWPATSTANSVMTVGTNNVMSWTPTATLLGSCLKVDGSSPITGALTSSFDGSEGLPTLTRGDMGLYLASGNGVDLFGIGYKNRRVMEIRGSDAVLTGVADTGSGALVRLRNVPVAGVLPPTYSFAGASSSGLGQTSTTDVSLILANQPALTVNSTTVSVHSKKITNLVDGTADSDAATVGYVNSKVTARKAISFRITALPLGYTANSSNDIVLSLIDATLIYSSNVATLTYESASTLASLIVPSTFNTEPSCQVFINGLLLRKMPNALSVREVRRMNNQALILAFPIDVGSIITVWL